MTEISAPAPTFAFELDQVQSFVLRLVLMRRIPIVLAPLKQIPATRLHHPPTGRNNKRSFKRVRFGDTIFPLLPVPLELSEVSRCEYQGGRFEVNLRFVKPNGYLVHEPEISREVKISLEALLHFIWGRITLERVMQNLVITTYLPSKIGDPKNLIFFFDGGVQVKGFQPTEF